MPPGKIKLTEAEKALVRAWIEGGAHDSGRRRQGDDNAAPDHPRRIGVSGRFAGRCVPLRPW